MGCSWPLHVLVCMQFLVIRLFSQNLSKCILEENPCSYFLNSIVLPHKLKTILHTLEMSLTPGPDIFTELVLYKTNQYVVPRTQC